MKLDRRFLNVSITVKGIVNEPPTSPAPTEGTQYIVGSSGTGAFGDADVNDIARYDGSKWTFTKPRAGEFEVFNLDTLEILSWNGGAWTALTQLKSAVDDSSEETVSSAPVTIVQGLVENSYERPDLTASTSNLGRVFVDRNQGYIYKEDYTNGGYKWMLIEDNLGGDKYLRVTPNRGDDEIYVVSFDDAGKPVETEPVNSEIFLVSAAKRDTYQVNNYQGKLFIYNVKESTLKQIGTTAFADSDDDTNTGLYIGTHTLTANDIESSGFTLPSKPLTINNGNPIILSVGGVIQTFGVDFRVTHIGNAEDYENEVWLVRWNNLGLSKMTLNVGDVFTLMYQPDPVQPEKH